MAPNISLLNMFNDLIQRPEDDDHRDTLPGVFVYRGKIVSVSPSFHCTYADQHGAI